jgi:hypothetical protein
MTGPRTAWSGRENNASVRYLNDGVACSSTPELRGQALALLVRIGLELQSALRRPLTRFLGHHLLWSRAPEEGRQDSKQVLNLLCVFPLRSAPGELENMGTLR